MSSFMGLAQPIFAALEAKTASYQITPGDVGKVFTNKGAGGAVTFTLPAIAEVQTGWYVDVLVMANQNVLVTAPAGKMVTFNNAAAATVAFQTAGNLIGASVRIIYDGALYFARPNGANTLTVA
jgi:hypothetical protein